MPATPGCCRSSRSTTAHTHSQAGEYRRIAPARGGAGVPRAERRPFCGDGRVVATYFFVLAGSAVIMVVAAVAQNLVTWRAYFVKVCEGSSSASAARNDSKGTSMLRQRISPTSQAVAVVPGSVTPPVEGRKERIICVSWPRWSGATSRTWSADHEAYPAFGHDADFAIHTRDIARWQECLVRAGTGAGWDALTRCHHGTRNSHRAPKASCSTTWSRTSNSSVSTLPWRHALGSALVHHRRY